MSQAKPASVDSICELLESGQPEQALEALERLQAESGPEETDPVVDFLGGVARMDLGRSREAAELLKRAVEADPEDPEFRTNYAWALFRSVEFNAAREALAPVLALDEKDSESVYLQGLLAERAEDWESAEQAFQAAATLDPERFPAPNRLSEAEFRSCLQEAMDRLPEDFGRHLEQVAVIVEPLPSEALLRADDPPFEPDDLLGLFTGPTVGEIGSFESVPDGPPRILLFQKNLERACKDEDQLREEIAVTIYHELGHYLGLDEEEIAAIDLG